jgi:hypothetical protein
VKRILIAAVIAISATAPISVTALAHSDLDDTSWKAPKNECNLGIDFNSDGTATIYEGGEPVDTAHWKLDGNALHLKFDALYGGIDGTYDGGDRIAATETWRDKSTQVVHNDPCPFEKAK